MGKPDIDSWIASTEASDDEHIEVASSLSPNNWPAFIESARTSLLSGSTKLRIDFIDTQLLPLASNADLTLDKILDIFQLLTLTYPRYIDAPSRTAVEAVGEKLVERDEGHKGPTGSKLGVADQIIGWIHTEASRICRRGSIGSSAPTNQYSLLHWCCGLYTVCLKSNPHFTKLRPWSLLVEGFAFLLDAVLDPTAHAKPSLRTGATNRVRRALRTAPSQVSTLIETILNLAKSSPQPTVFAPLLGLACDLKIHLKNGDPLEPPQKDVLQYFSTSVLTSKTPVPSHVTKAFRSFISETVGEADFKDSVLPVMEKASLRSPEVALPVVSEFFAAYQHPLSNDHFRRVLIIVLNSSKSSNPVTRTNAVALFKVLSQRNTDQSIVDLCLDEILGPAKAGKTTGPDHRLALYSMLSLLPPSEPTSRTIAETAPYLLAKETSDIVLPILTALLVPHLVCLLKSGIPLPRETISTTVKEMTSTRPTLRRSMYSLTGSALWECSDTTNEAVKIFVTAVVPTLESGLKNVASNPLHTVAGPLEGYIALASLLGPLSRFPQFENIVSRNPTLQSLASTSAKPSFLLWDKVYQKLSTFDEEKWILRALVAATAFLKNDLKKSEQLRQQVGLAYLQLVVETQHIETRRLVLSTLELENVRWPQLTSQIVREALSAYLLREESKAAPVEEDDAEHPTPRSKQSHLAALLATSTAFGADVDTGDKQIILAESLILAHHPGVAGESRQLWIDLCQRGQLDPHNVIVAQTDSLLQKVLSSNHNSSPAFQSATYRAITTLTFVAPSTILPPTITQIENDLNMLALRKITETDVAIWRTPEGTTYVDVLVAKSHKTAITKGKNAAIEKWEAELRSSLASKNPQKTLQSLSKQDKELVEAQLQREAEVRRRVEAVKQILQRGLLVVQSVVKSRVEELNAYAGRLVDTLLNGVVRHKSNLVGESTYETYLDLGQICSERLGVYRTWMGVATLRCLNAEIVPEERRAEPLHSLVLRVLYRLRALSEQAPLDSPTFSYIAPLLSHVIAVNGITGEENDDERAEFIALCVDIIKFHTSEFVDNKYPREQILRDLLLVIKRHPSQGKEATSALIAVGESIHDQASLPEVNVLFTGILAQEVYVRNASLQCLQPIDLIDIDWSRELWIGQYDADQQNARLARHVWEENALDVPENFFDDLYAFLSHENASVRRSTASSLTDAAAQWPGRVSLILKKLGDDYCEKATVKGPEFDDYGILIQRSAEDPWHERLAIAHSLEALAPILSEDLIEPLLMFLFDDEALGDRSSEVRQAMLAAASRVIDLHGKVKLQEIVTLLEKYLASANPTSEKGDHMKEAAVILLGRSARHLEANDGRIPTVVKRLVEVLKTPSEQVQVAVSECLAPLITFIRDDASSLVEDLFKQLFNAPKYGERRGAAYGIAGVIKGTGIVGVNEFGILSRIRNALEDKKRYEPRQGAMFLLETLSVTLARSFEPYVIQLLPSLLASFGDAVPDVREAAEEAAKVVMANMSGYGVKQILPTLLGGLEEKQWRTKKGAIELLGTMAFCAPKQLSLSFPTVIPRLSGVLTDSHAQVKTAANRGLKQFGEVISNPEIQALVPVFLKALVDPAKVPNALTALLKTSFAHYIDAPSLALVIPIIERGLRERGAEAKRKAAQIVGNLASLTESQDFVPYLDRLLPLVHVVLVDPVPEARATAAKALGILVERLGEEQFPDLVPSLLKTLKTDNSGVDRQGAAQGLSEVLAGLGMERLESLLPDIVSNAQSPRSTVREGFMSLLVYLPATFGARFQPHLTKIVNPILSGLSDTEEYVRDAAMRAGRMIITNYSNKAVDLLLPELERGMFDGSWRIRQSSITLVGELLFKVSGISGKAEIEEEAEAAGVTAMESSRRALSEALGKERRDRVLAALYIVRQDAVSNVRQAGVHIWKALVHNTPRTVRELLPELVNQIVYLLVGDNDESQDMATRTMGELCRKFGERILGEIIPLLRTSSQSSDSLAREGTCLALCEIMANATDTQRENYDDNIAAMVRQALVDDEANVRAAAAKAFDSLQEHLGASAIDQTIPTLLEALRQPGESSGTALQALKEVMAVRANSVFPVLIPTLTASPVTAFNARALASLIAVAGSALSKRLSQVLGALVTSLENEKNPETLCAVKEAIEVLMESIPDAEGLHSLMIILLDWARSTSPARRTSACKLFAVFCEKSDLDDSLYRTDWIRQLITLLDDGQESVHTSALQAMDVFIKSVPKDELEPLVVPLRRTIESTGAPGRTVPGLSLQKGVAPMVPVIIAGLTTGSNEQREHAALAIGDLVVRTEESAFKPFVVPFTGPLIRVAAQSTTYPPGVKSAILTSLTTMLEKIPAFVKPFFPQLQRTFVKAVSDNSSLAVRNRACTALGVLMRSQPRVDAVITELLAGTKGGDEVIAASHVNALAQVVRNASANVGEKAKEACADFISDTFRESHDEQFIKAVAELFASLSVFPDLLSPTITTYLVGGTSPSIVASHVILATLSISAESETPNENIFLKLGLLPSIRQKVQESIGSDMPSVSRPAREARDLLNSTTVYSTR